MPTITTFDNTAEGWERSLYAFLAEKERRRSSRSARLSTFRGRRTDMNENPTSNKAQLTLLLLAVALLFVIGCGVKESDGTLGSAPRTYEAVGPLFNKATFSATYTLTAHGPDLNVSLRVRWMKTGGEHAKTRIDIEMSPTETVTFIRAAERPILCFATRDSAGSSGSCVDMSPPTANAGADALAPVFGGDVQSSHPEDIAGEPAMCYAVSSSEIPSEENCFSSDGVRPNPVGLSL